MRTLRLYLVGTAILALLAGLSGAVLAQDKPSSRPPIASAGCGDSEVEPGKHQGLSLDVDGTERQWAMYVPEGHDGVTPLPLWLQFHGYGMSSAGEVSMLSTDAEENGFVVVAPQAPPSGDMFFDPASAAVDLTNANPDLAFVEALIDRVGTRLCIDLARVYAAGFSMGAEGATILGCVLGDRVAAVAPVSGVIDLGDGCTGERPVPHLTVHGSSDWFDGGVKPHWEGTLVEVLRRGSVPERVAKIAIRNGCEPDPSAEVLDVVVEGWSDSPERWTWDCPPGADVGLLVHSSGHAWPQRGSVGFDGTELVWEFFEQHPMPE